MLKAQFQFIFDLQNIVTHERPPFSFTQTRMQCNSVDRLMIDGNRCDMILNRHWEAEELKTKSHRKDEKLMHIWSSKHCHPWKTTIFFYTDQNAMQQCGQINDRWQNRLCDMILNRHWEAEGLKTKSHRKDEKLMDVRYM